MSKRWNSGRLTSMSPTVSPRPDTEPGEPAGDPLDLRRVLRHVMATWSPGLRSAISSGRSRAVSWKAWQRVGASSAAGRVAAAGAAAWRSIPRP